jgi:adenylyl-sulfate kinase
MIIWFTGFSGSGKTTLAQGVADRLCAKGAQPLLIDGDRLREELCRDLGFSPADRAENIRRAGAIALMASRSGLISICSLISPLRKERDSIRKLCADRGFLFLEVYVSTPLDVCEFRDPKGLYKRARSGQLPQFTGIDSPYEPPLYPEITVPTEKMEINEAIEFLWERLGTFFQNQENLY